MNKDKVSERRRVYSPSVPHEAWLRRALRRDPEFRKAMSEPSDDPFLDVAYYMVTLREKRGWTQAQLARKVGTSQQAIARLENPGYRGHSLTTLVKIAKAFGKELRVQFA